MSDSLDVIRSQTISIGAALGGSSAEVQVLGSMGRDDHPERLLAVALAHTQNALAAVIEELEAQRLELKKIRRQIQS